LNAASGYEESDGSQSAQAGSVTVVLIDDQALVRRAVRQALTRAGLRVIGEADAAETGVRMAVERRPDVVLMDLILDGAPATDAIEQVSVLAPASRILVLTTSTERDCLVQAILAGACGYLLKDVQPGVIASAVRASAAGECVVSPQVAEGLLARIREGNGHPQVRDERSAEMIRAVLSGRELEIFKRLASGESNREIGRAFSLSENTVRKHVASILAKLHLDNRVQAAVKAVRSGFFAFAGLLPLKALSKEGELADTIASLLLGA
jgi:two-component system, NarL family, nitrate/nitrite response regulator NarL